MTNSWKGTEKAIHKLLLKKYSPDYHVRLSNHVEDEAGFDFIISKWINDIPIKLVQAKTLTKNNSLHEILNNDKIKFWSNKSKIYEVWIWDIIKKEIHKILNNQELKKYYKEKEIIIKNKQQKLEDLLNEATCEDFKIAFFNIGELPDKRKHWNQKIFVKFLLNNKDKKIIDELKKVVLKSKEKNKKDKVI